MKRALILVAAWGLVSCATAQYGGDPAGPGGRPAWVDGKGSRYPEMMYLTAVGHAPAQPQCENDARAAMAKIFVAQVSQISQEWQGYFSKVSSMGVAVKVEATSISVLTSVSTDKTLKDVEIKEHWAGDGTSHCLATLERDRVERTLREEIARLDAEINARIKQGDAETNDTTRFMAYAAAMELLPRRETLNADLRIVSARGVGVPPAVDMGSFLAKFTTARAKVKVGLKITGTEATRLQTCMAEGLTRKGLRVLEGTSDVDVIIHATLKYSKAGYVEGSEMVRADINLRVTDLSGGQTLAAFADEVKVGRPTLQTAIQLAVVKLCEKATDVLPQKIFDSFKR
jgi:hypothetical protein